MRKQGLGHHLIAALLLGVLCASPAHASVQEAGGETYTYAASGDLSSAGASSYAYEDPANAQAVTRIVDGTDERLLGYDQDGHLIRDRRLSGGTQTMERVFAVDDASCMVHASELNAQGQAVKQSEYRCDADGITRARDSVDLVTGWRNWVHHFGGNIEARPDEEGGVLIIRVPLVGTQVIFEDARSLATGAAIPERSAYLHKDIRGSVVAETYPDGSGFHVLDHGPWGETLTGPSRTRHHFVDYEADPFFDAYSFGVRNYDPILRRWTSPDPLFFVSPENEPAATARRQLNLYGYAGNDPVNKIDTTGNFLLTAYNVASFASSVNAIRKWDSNTSLLTKAIDVVSVVADGAALVSGTAAPGTAIRAVGKVAKGVDRAINAAKTVDKGVDVAKGAGKGARPPSLSPEGAGRNGAFREAKRKNDIPVTQHPSSVEPNVDKRNKPQPGRIYKFDRGRDQPPVTIREDSGGHFFGPNDPQNRGPHFNDDKKRHYDY